jgi:ABC-type phosphate/phosphonate transport system substrate-binding protein
VASRPAITHSSRSAPDGARIASELITNKSVLIHSFIRPLILFMGIIGSLLSYAHAAEPVKIGVLAYRPKPQTLAQWQPLAVALKKAMPEHDFVVEALTYPELDQAVSGSKLDFVLTNSGHYVLLKRLRGLSSPLATLIVEENGQQTSLFGGVIFSLAGKAHPDTLSDIKGKTIAITGKGSLGGYQMQAYELSRAGIHLPQDARLLATGMPQDNVIEAVLSGRAEFGFVRTGVLEDMAREGRLDINKIEVINPQKLPGFAMQSSTRLYPEWPFSAMPHIDENLACAFCARRRQDGDPRDRRSRLCSARRLQLGGGSAARVAHAAFRSGPALHTKGCLAEISRSDAGSPVRNRTDFVAGHSPFGDEPESQTRKNQTSRE